MWRIIDPDTSEVIATFSCMPNLAAIREFVPNAQSMGDYNAHGGIFTVKYGHSTVAWVRKDEQ